MSPIKREPPVTISTIRGDGSEYPISVREFTDGDLSLRQRDQIIVIARSQLAKFLIVLGNHDKQLNDYDKVVDLQEK